MHESIGHNSGTTRRNEESSGKAKNMGQLIFRKQCTYEIHGSKDMRGNKSAKMHV